MSGGPRLPFEEALKLAKHLVDELTPAVKRLKVAGSVRRKKATVGDIEIVAEPFMYQQNLFGELAPDVQQILFVCKQIGTVLKSGQRMIQVGDVLGKPGLNLDLHLVHPPAQWGSILAIRTGPYELGKLAMIRMGMLGRQHQDGFVIESASRRLLPTPEEEDFFLLAGLPCLPPIQREQYVAELRERSKASGQK